MSKLGNFIKKPKSACLTPDLGKTTAILPDIQVSYSETKVYNVDRLQLLKNRIFTQDRIAGISDRFNQLRRQILSKLQELDGNSFLVTSANPGEGKTFIAINLGICLAQEFNRTVLLVDTDLKNTKAHHADLANIFLGIRPGKGLADYLLGEAEVPEILLNPGIHKLTILPGGTPLHNSTDLLGSVRMVSLINEVKKRYADRIIIFDATSLVYADPMILSHYVDGVLLVVEQDKTNSQDLHQAMTLLKDSNIIGSILNKSRSGKTVYI